jgi:hypothetical protein
MILPNTYVIHTSPRLLAFGRRRKMGLSCVSMMKGRIWIVALGCFLSVESIFVRGGFMDSLTG